MHIIGSVLVAAVLLCASSLIRAAPDIQHWQTSNGMRVYFVAAPELPMIDIRMAFDAGSGRDGKLPGLARLTAGLLDTGIGELDATRIAARFENVGAHYSADARRDSTNTSLRSLIDPEQLEPALDTYIRVMTAPTFPERDFERGKQLTLVSLQSQAQDPGDVATKAFYKAVYGDHPYAHLVTGDEASIKAIKLEDVRRFHARYFVASNAVLAIVGQLDREGAQKLAGRISAAFPKGQPAEPLPPVKKLDEPQTLRIPFPSQQAHVYIGQPGISRDDPNYFPLYVGNHVLGGSGFNSRLVKEVRVKRGLSYSVYSYFSPQSVAGPFLIGLQTRGDQAEEAAQLAKDTVKAFLEEGPRDEELTASTRNITGGFPLRIDSNGDIVGYLATIGFYNLPLDYLATFNSKVTAVDKAEIRTAFRQRLDLERLITVIVGG